MMLLLALALAAELTPDPAFERARSAFEEGLRSLDAGDSAAAVGAFERSLALRESSAALYNLALACKRSARPPCALRALDRYLSLGGPDAEEHARARSMADELRASVAILSLRVVGGTATVSLDGAALRGDLHGLILAPGAHRLELARVGFEPERLDLELEAGVSVERTLGAGLRPLPARVLIELPRDDVALWIDGAPAAPGPRTLAAGAHELEVRSGDEQLLARRLVLAPGEERREWLDVPPAKTSVVETWWFWTGVGVALAAGTAIAVVAATASPPGPDGGTLGFTLEALRPRSGW